MKRIRLLLKRALILIFLFVPVLLIINQVKATDQEYLKVNGSQITLTDGTKVKINTEYDLKGQEFRACWVSSAVSDIAGFSTEIGYKSMITSLLDNVSKLNLNAIIFHIRVKNDAFYESKYNKWSVYYNTDPTWDALPWVIEECHRRGIEFHAWMNPYRVSQSQSANLEELSKSFLPTNPASNPANLLNCTSCVILDPGIPEVQDFLVETCMEVVENYNVDAIHFDDYFYASGCDDTATRAKYNTSNLSTADFRRKAVTTFIEKLSYRLRKFNLNNNRRVQLGISPTGVYSNGNGSVTFDSYGNVKSNGSRTGGYSHYGSPLYADTLDWINHEWIDYICPQTYHAITNGAVPFCEITNWWNKVCAKTNTNLYVSMGLYMKGGVGNASWYSNSKEAYDQIMYMNTLENVRGMSVYSYSALSALSAGSINHVWDTPVIPPQVRTMDPIIIDGIESLDIKKTSFGNLLTFPKNDSAKFYCIYRSKDPITFDASEVIDVVGDISVDGVITYPDNTDDELYYYGVRCLSWSNHLSDGVSGINTKVDANALAKLELAPNFKVSDNILNGEEVNITWNKIIYHLDNNVKYNLEYQFDESSFYCGTIENYRGMLLSKVKIPSSAKKMTIKLTCYNDIAQSILTETYDITPSLGHIYNFGLLASDYSNKDVPFYFLTLENSNSDYKYTLEGSYDGLNFTDITTIDGANEAITTITSKLLNYQSNTYYRIRAKYNGYFGYSDVVSYNTKEYLGDIGEVLINNEEVKDKYLFNEDDEVVIVLSKIDGASYSILYSVDGVNWLNLNNYDRHLTKEITDTSYKITFKVSYQYFKVYLKVLVVKGMKETSFDKIEINARLSFLYSEDIMQYYHSEIKEQVSELKLFN